MVQFIQNFINMVDIAQEFLLPSSNLKYNELKQTMLHSIFEILNKIIV